MKTHKYRIVKRTYDTCSTYIIQRQTKFLKIWRTYCNLIDIDAYDYQDWSFFKTDPVEYPNIASAESEINRFLNIENLEKPYEETIKYIP